MIAAASRIISSFTQILVCPTNHNCNSALSSSHLLRHEYIKNLGSFYASTNTTTQTGIWPRRSSCSADPGMVGIFTLLQDLGLNERETELLLQTNPSLTHASTVSLLDRILSLQSVGIVGFGMSRLITRKPEILTSQEIGTFISYVHKDLEGIEPVKLKHLLVTIEPELVTGFSEKVTLLLDHGIPQEKLGHFLNNINLKVFCYRQVEEIERVIVFLKRFGVDVILRRPVLLNLDLESQLIPRYRFLTDLGGDEKAAVVLVHKFPPILAYTVEHLEDHVEFLRTVGLSYEEIFKIVLVYPSVFSISKARKMNPRIGFLKQCGLDATDIYRFLIKAPLFLSLSFEDNLSMKLCFLVKLGYKNRTRELALAMGATTRTSCQNLQMVIEVFLSHGFSCEDVLVMSKKHPQVLQYNYKSLEKKMKFLIEGMGREIGELLAFPAYLGYKLDERIKHRYEAKKKTRGKGLSLNKLLSVSTARFTSSENLTEMKYAYFDDMKKDL